MNDINQVSSDVLNSLSINSQQSNAAEEDELGKDAFLQLMIAQLQNQDPLSPAKNEDFVAQLAQFSTVEGIGNMNASLDQLNSSFRSSQALEASALVGRQVEVESNIATYIPGQPVRGTIGFATSAQNVKLTIETLDGEVFDTQDLGTQSAGELDFSWDGTNESGLQVEGGVYLVRAVGLVDGESTELPISVGANVNSVTVGQNNSMILNIEGVGPVPLSAVSRFL